jgi:hypothetical protein
MAGRAAGDGVNRREFVKAGAGLAATVSLAHVPVSRAACTACTACAHPAIAIVDPSLFESVAWASAAARDGARVVECGGDVAVLWYEVLARSRVLLVGALRASDFFVLRCLARSDGRAVAHEAAGAGTVAFRIMGASAA